MVLAACRNSGTIGGRGIAACGCNTSALIPTLQPSSSSAWGVISLPSASTSKLPVHRSPGDNRLVVRALTTPLAVPTITVFDPSIGPKYLPCSNRESKGHQPTVGWLQRHPPHSLTELCQRGNSAPSHIFFRVLSCRLDPLKTDERMLEAYDTSHVNRSWSAGTSTPEADSTANLIDLTCPLTTFTELSAAPLACWVTFNRRFLHHVTSPGQSHRPE